jgi:hypothetical protein
VLVANKLVEWCSHRSTKHNAAGKSTESETPRPSSRETATPPRWVSDAERTVGAKPSVWSASQDNLHAERTEAGPGPGATCRQNRSDTSFKGDLTHLIPKQVGIGADEV